MDAIGEVNSARRTANIFRRARVCAVHAKWRAQGGIRRQDLFLINRRNVYCCFVAFCMDLRIDLAHVTTTSLVYAARLL